VTRLLPLLCWLLAAPALAGGGATLFDDGEWRAVGMGAGSMAVIGPGGQGDFAALELSYDLGMGFVPVLRLLDDGTIEPTLPPPGEPGATAVLGRYFECDAGLTDPLRFVFLALPEKAKGGRLELTGTLSNLDSLVSDKLKIDLQQPKADRVRVELRYKLRATRDLCVDPERRDTQEEFRIVELHTRFLSPAEHLSDLTRYVKAIDLDCDTFGDCDFDRRSYCAALENVTGYVIESPNRLRGREIGLFHTSNAPGPTPTLTIEMQKPNPHAVKPQGFVVQSADPGARNVTFWADWADAKRDYKNGKTLGSFRFALEAEPPRNPSCDRRQD
jgi:hypothetical protein